MSPGYLTCVFNPEERVQPLGRHIQGVVQLARHPAVICLAASTVPLTMADIPEDLKHDGQDGQSKTGRSLPTVPQG